MKLHQSYKVALLVAFLGLAACGKTSDNRSASRGTTGMLAETCADGSKATGAVYDTAGYGFRENFIALLSATMNPNDIGEISGVRGASTGVDMRLRIGRTAGGGSVTVANTKLNLIIYDSYVGQASTINPGQAIQPLTISMNASNVASNGNELVITFGDQYGTITAHLQGTNPNFTGTLEFANYQSATGGSPASGQLGSFVVPSCGF